MVHAVVHPEIQPLLAWSPLQKRIDYISLFSFAVCFLAPPPDIPPLSMTMLPPLIAFTMPKNEYLPRKVMHGVYDNEWTLWKGEGEINPILFLPSVRLPASPCQYRSPSPSLQSPKQAEPETSRTLQGPSLRKAPIIPHPLPCLFVSTLLDMYSLCPFTRRERKRSHQSTSPSPPPAHCAMSSFPIRTKQMSYIQ